MEILAHRGESYIAPENTLASIKLAWEKGADAVEIDVRLTRDNKIVVIHDLSTGRITGTDLMVSETDADELRKLDFGKSTGEQFAGERIPFLEEVLATIPPRGMLLIEIKCGVDVLPILRDTIDVSDKRSQVTIISFDLAVVSASKKLMSDILTYWLGAPEKDPITGRYRLYDLKLIQIVLDNNLDGLSLQYSQLTEEFVDEVKAAGLALWTWNVNDPAEAKRLMEMGVDGLGTDRCEWIKRQMR